MKMNHTRTKIFLFFEILFLSFFFPFAISKVRKRKAKNKIKNYFLTFFNKKK